MVFNIRVICFNLRICDLLFLMSALLWAHFVRIGVRFLVHAVFAMASGQRSVVLQAVFDLAGAGVLGNSGAAAGANIVDHKF